MALVTLDVVVLLPKYHRALAVKCSGELADKMMSGGTSPQFRLGHPFLGHGHDVCEPHISLFMMAVEDDEIASVAAALAGLEHTLPSIPAVGAEYRHNKEGAPELFYARCDEFREVQRGVVAVAEPLRKGRLRELDPSGRPLAAVVDDPNPDDPARIRQLRKYGFDDISDADDDRFNPHVTLCWPANEDSRVPLAGLPPVNEFSSTLSEIGLFSMGPNGTCLTSYGRWSLKPDRDV
jgi:hypothetical protein